MPLSGHRWDAGGRGECCHLLALTDENSQSSGHCRRGPWSCDALPTEERTLPLSGLGWAVTALTRRAGQSRATDVKGGEKTPGTAPYPIETFAWASGGSRHPVASLTQPRLLCQGGHGGDHALLQFVVQKITSRSPWWLS